MIIPLWQLQKFNSPFSVQAMIKLGFSGCTINPAILKFAGSNSFTKSPVCVL